MTGPVDSLLEQFVAGSWTFVTGLPAGQRTESLHIDYKQKKAAGTGALDGEDRQNLSIALSGFANADGGLLVWGVKAKPDADGIDQVQAIMPINQLGRFRSDLETVTPDMVSFPVAGVQHIPIPTKPDMDEGVMVTVVPRSDLAPHMASGTGLHRYYRRTSSRFQTMEHYEVADLFGRRPQPVIHVRPFWELNKTSDGRFHFVVQFMVENRGRGIARFPSLTLGHPPEDWPLLSGTDMYSVGGPFRKVHAPFGWFLRYRGAADDVLHPGDRFTVAHVAFELASEEGRQTFRIKYEAVAEGCPAIDGTFELDFFILHMLMREGRESYKPPDHPDNDPA